MPAELRRPLRVASGRRSRRQGCAHRALLTLVCLLHLAHSARAGMQDTLAAIEGSEFRFARTKSEVPFLPLGWLQDQYYPNTTFKAEGSAVSDALAAENTVSFGGVLPAFVANRDMLLLGGDVIQDYISVKSGPYPDQNVLELTPVAAWLHQFGSNDLVGAFVAPIFSKELRGDQPWGYSGYGGVICMHYYSDEFQLLYGGVYEYSFGRQTGYPYLGVNWLPTPQTSLTLTIPWPTFTYALSDRWIVQLGLSPGGSSWVLHDGNYQATESLSSWNLIAGGGYRFYNKFWVVGGAGVAGLRGVDIQSDNGAGRLDASPSPVISIAVQFRP